MGGSEIAAAGVALSIAVSASVAVAANYLAYVANGADGTISIVDTQDATVLRTIGVGADPGAMTLSPDRLYLWVVNFAGGSVTIINTHTRSIANTVSFGQDSRPLAVAFAPDGQHAYVTLETPMELAVVDTDLALGGNDPVVGRIALGAQARGVAAAADGGAVYVSGEATSGKGELYEIDPTSQQVVATIAVDDSPLGVGISADGARAYVAAAGKISVVDLAERAKVASIVFGIEGGTTQYNHSVSSAPSGTIYATNNARQAIAVIEDIDLERSIPANGPSGRAG